MAVVPPCGRRGRRFRKRRSGPNVKEHAQSAGDLHNHTDTTPEPKFSQDSIIGFDAGDSGDSSGCNTPKAIQQEKDSARVTTPTYQEDELPAAPQDLDSPDILALAAPQDLNSPDILAHAIICGFKMNGVKKLPKFLQRRASPRDATTENIVEIKESRVNGKALIITVKAEDLPKFTSLNGISFAGRRLAIRPSRIEDYGSSASQTETSVQTPKAESSRLGSDQSADVSQPADMHLASHPVEPSEPVLPVLNFLAAASAPNEGLQHDNKLEAPEIKEEEIVIQLSEIAGISLPISHLCLSQSDWDLELALEAVNFATEFASPNDLTLQTSILCLDYNLWDMKTATLFVKSVAQGLSDKTGMTMNWSIDCLAANGWTAKEAMEAFEEAKDLLPSEAFKKE